MLRSGYDHNVNLDLGLILRAKIPSEIKVEVEGMDRLKLISNGFLEMLN